MKTFLINLDRNPERLERMSALLASMELPYQRIAAIDGAALTDAALSGASPALSRGEIGCLLSHRAAWQIIASGPDPYGAVLEDDIHMAPDLPGFLSGWDWIPDGADVVKLETSCDHVFVESTHRAIHAGHRLTRLQSTHPGTAAYIISSQAARTALERTAGIARPVDAALFELPDGAARGLVVYQADPALCIQDDFLRGAKTPGLRSTIQNERKAVRQQTRGRLVRIRNSIVGPLAKTSRMLAQRLGLGPRGLEWRTIPIRLDQPEPLANPPETHRIDRQSAFGAL
jgi:glycosyl transferase family 25